MRLYVQVRPRAGADEVVGYAEGTLRVRVKAPPAGGKANGAVQALLADFFGLPRERVKIVAGHTGRRKLVALEGLGPEEFRERVGRLQAGRDS
ncbi:MAG: DUF167 domain-containing protein [Firmicutes bacterium]|nr:DUF167 domain-containing protein [Bacillota bacterium]